MSNDAQEIDLTPNELFSIRNAFPSDQLPLLYSFRTNIRYDKQSRSNSAVALSPHYVGLFTKENPASNFFSMNKLIHIHEIINVYYSSNPFVVVETAKTKVTITSKKSLHLAHLLYVIIKISYSYYPKQTAFIGDDKIFPPIMFSSVKRDPFSKFVSFPQQFQFTYSAECSACGVTYNHDVVRCINSMMLSANSIIDITQLPLDFSQLNQNKTTNSNQEAQKDDKSDIQKDDKKSNDKEKQKNDKENDKKNKDKKSKKDKKNDKKEKKNKEKEKNKKEKKRKDSKLKKDKNEKSDKNKSSKDENDEDDQSSDIYDNFDFTTIENSELVPIFKSLRYLEFANGVCCRNFHCPSILKLLHQLISEGKDIQIIHIENCDVTEGLDYLAHAIKFNAELEISYWNLSHNKFQDFHHFIMIINFSKGNLLYLNLNNCDISASDSSELFTAMWRNSMMHNLKYLYISNMNFINDKGEVQISSFEKYISRNGNIEALDISQIKSEAASEILSIFTNKPNKIKTLILKDIDFSNSKIASYEHLLNFLMKTETLENIDISNTGLDLTQIETVISTIAKNINSRKKIKKDLQINFKLSLGNLNLNGKNIMVLYRSFLETDMTMWNSLSFDHNGLNVNDLKNLVPLLFRMKNLTSLSLCGNFDYKMPEIEFALPLILKIPSLNTLYISGDKDHKLKNKVSILLDKVYKLNKLKILDVRNNSSYEALSSFVHILHSCTKMSQFLFDGSDFSSLEQFENLTGALNANKTITSAPFPIDDAQNFIKKCTKEQNKAKEAEEEEKNEESTKSKNKKDDKKKKKKKEEKKKKKSKDKKSKKDKKKEENADNAAADETENKKNLELDEQGIKNVFNEHTLNDIIKTLSELQVTAITAVNANRINQKMPNDLPFPATEEIQNLIQTISSKMRASIEKKNLNNYSCVSELLHLSLPFQNAGDAVKNGGVLRTINIGDLKQYNIKAMENVIENKKPIDKMNTMILPKTMMLQFNTLFNSKLGENDSSDSESSSTSDYESSTEEEEDEEEEEQKNRKESGSSKSRKKKQTKKKDEDDYDYDDSDYESSTKSESSKRQRRKSTKTATKKGRKNQNQTKRRKDSDTSDESEEDRPRKPTRKTTNQKNRNRNSSSESETDSDQEANHRPSSSTDEARRKRREQQRMKSQKRNQKRRNDPDYDDDYDDDDDDDYVVRRKKPQRRNTTKPTRRRHQYSDDDDEDYSGSDDSDEDEVVKPWNSGLKLKTRSGNDSRLDGLVDTSYIENYPSKKGGNRRSNARAGYSAGHFDEDTLDSLETNRNGRNNNNRRTKRKVTFNLA